ncbi:MAG: ComEC/Rec2 family competence protein, partial [bacterium]
MTGLAIVFVTGTGLGLAFPISQVVLLSLSAGGLVLAFLARRTSSLPIFATVLSIGWANATPNTGESERSIPALIKLPAGAGLTGLITDEPVCTATRNGKSTWKFPLAAEQARAGWTNGWQDVTGTVRVRLFTGPGDRIPSYGERWSFSGYLAQPIFKQGWFKGKPGGLFFSGAGRKARRLAAGEGNALIGQCLRGRAWTGKLLSVGITDRPEQTCILNSILLGYYSKIPRDLYQAFANTGTLHVFAISGSHVVILGGAIIFILAACGL